MEVELWPSKSGTLVEALVGRGDVLDVVIETWQPRAGHHGRSSPGAGRRVPVCDRCPPASPAGRRDRALRSRTPIPPGRRRSCLACDKRGHDRGESGHLDADEPGELPGDLGVEALNRLTNAVNLPGVFHDPALEKSKPFCLNRHIRLPQPYRRRPPMGNDDQGRRTVRANDDVWRNAVRPSSRCRICNLPGLQASKTLQVPGRRRGRCGPGCWRRTRETAWSCARCRSCGALTRTFPSARTGLAVRHPRVELVGRLAPT